MTHKKQHIFVTNTYLLVLLLSIILSSSASGTENNLYSARIQITNVSDLPNDITATVNLVLDGGSDYENYVRNTVHREIILTGKDRDDNDHRHFFTAFTKLKFPPGSTKGFIHGEISANDGTLHRKIPLTIFELSEADDRYAIIKSISAKSSEDAFRESYPMRNPSRGFFTDENVEFSLLIFRTLVSNGYVGPVVEWNRVYEFFIVNAEYFKSGGADRVSRILTFLESQYDKSLANPTTIQSKHFIQFYAQFMNKMFELDIGGRTSPTQASFDDYIVSRMKKIIGTSLKSTLHEIQSALSVLFRLNKPQICLDIANAAATRILHDQGIIGSITNDSDEEKQIKLLLKNTIDCAQLFFVLKSSGDSSRGDLINGADFLKSSSSFGQTLTSTFMQIFEKFETTGLFPRRENHGDWAQIYDYYDVLNDRKSKGDS